MKTRTSKNFTGNFFKFLIVPAVALVMALVFGLCFGFNKDLDTKGGIVVSVNVGMNDLSDQQTYDAFKNDIDEVLTINNFSGDLYTVEVNEFNENIMVIKFAYSGKAEEKQARLEDLKQNLTTRFHSGANDNELANNNYVIVAEFGSSFDSSLLTTVGLATLVAVIVMCVYVAIRMGLNSAVLGLVASVFNNLFTFALMLVLRVPFTYATLAVIPFVAIASVFATMFFSKKAKELINKTEEYKASTNAKIANQVTTQTLKGQKLLFAVLGGALVLIGLFNVCNSVLFTSLAFLLGLVAVLYTNICLLPFMFAKTYVRRVKKAKKQEKKQEKKYTEAEVMQETDLDNLVSN
ncbi:MAG: hypothetical protein E7378_00960 [Clostridiales bacterium]|nr:hypothetical protein [Clostridiales bacterium]